MFRKEFPDIKWLKSQINIGDKSFKWPNVVLNVNSGSIYRPDIKGPLSLFMNINGRSRCSVDKYSVSIPEDYYFITNKDEHYSLEIEAGASSETFNVHFADNMVENIYMDLITASEKLLDNPYQQGAPVLFFNKLYPKDDRLKAIILQIKNTHSKIKPNPILLEEQLILLVVYLLEVHFSVMRQLEALPALKRATRAEIFKRLSASLDYLYMQYDQELSLDKLAEIACMSKFHFLRLFKFTYKVTPYQFMLMLRLEKAKKLLKETYLPVQDIALQLGFENHSSFSRLFYQKNNCWPIEFRNSIRKKQFW
jgi:AraC family transcriptional regulator